MKYSDQMLIDFLNGRLSQAVRQQIEVDLLADPNLERRMMALDDMAPVVAKTFERIPGPERRQRLAAKLAPAPARPWSLSLVSGLAASILVCSIAFYYFSQTPTDWRNVVAQYQSLYVPETVAHLNIDPAQMQSDLSRASDAIQMKLALETVSNVDGLRLRRIQTLGFNGRPLVQLVYTDHAGVPVALCLTSGDDGTSGSSTRTGLASYSWGTGTHQFMMIGALDQQELNRLATLVEQRMRAPLPTDRARG